jgi:hypothetical protein
LRLRLPVLLDVKGPLELEVLVLVVVGEDGDGLVVAAEEHARGCGFGLDFGGGRMLDDCIIGEEDVDVEDLHFFSYSGLSVVLGE